MLRERNASMADRSLSSLTGELLLLATAAVAFTTFAARRLRKSGRPRVGVNMAVVWECGAREQRDVWRWSEASSPKHQTNMSRWPTVTGHTEERRGTEGGGHKGERASVTWKGRGQEQCRTDPGWHQQAPTPQPQRSTKPQEAGEGSNEELKETKKQRWKLTEVNHINQITREGSRNEKKGKKHSTQWKAAAEDRPSLTIRKDTMPKTLQGDTK